MNLKELSGLMSFVLFIEFLCFEVLLISTLSQYTIPFCLFGFCIGAGFFYFFYKEKIETNRGKEKDGKRGRGEKIDRD